MQNVAFKLFESILSNAAEWKAMNLSASQAGTASFSTLSFENSFPKWLCA